MRIAGIYPQSIETDPKIQHAVSEPYSLEKILSVAANDDHDVDLYMPIKDEAGSVVSTSEEDLVERILEFKPDVAAFSLYTCQYPMGKRIAKKLKQSMPKIVNIAGNRFPTFRKNNLEDPFDFFVIKEGEITFKELLREIQTTKNYQGIKGLSFNRNGQTVFTGVRPRNFDLDSLPNALRFPIILKQSYKGISLPSLSEEPHFAIMEYSRSCYNACKFCDNTGFWGNKLAFRSAKKVVDELFELKEKGVSLVYFMDLNFTAVPEKTLELCNEIKDSHLDISWYCMSNIHTVDQNPDLLYAMKEAGCHRIAWGVESTSDRALKLMNKKTNRVSLTNDECTRVLQKSLEAGMVNQGFYIIGFPWETEDSIIKDAEYLRYLPIHQLNVGIFTPIPLSRFYDDLQGQGYTFDPNLEKHDRNHLVYSHGSLTHDKIKAIQEKMHKEFYGSPQYVERVKTSCTIDPRFKQAFNDYFQFLGKEVRV